ncbi:hypothetical protein C8R43DRAFT_1151143 [Mycena crocata]|nr:hypothetical protein C8R43DRAFT_1151143 [Mycena crocata]
MSEFEIGISQRQIIRHGILNRVPEIELIEILGTAQKTIYSARRSQRGTEWSQTIVAELDSSLNEWLDSSIPDHLRWDPHRADETFATQSACLYAAYHHEILSVQIQIHRSFIPSLANDTHLPSVMSKHQYMVLMDSAIVHLLNVWGARRIERFADPQRAANDVQKCISVLKMYERRDMLFSIGNTIINAPQVSSTLPPTLRRVQEEVDTEPPSTTVAHEVSDPRNIANSHCLSFAVDQQDKSLGSTVDLYPLPISTEELGHLPVYQSFDWGIPFRTVDDGFTFNTETAPQYDDVDVNSNVESTSACQHIIRAAV